MYHNLWYTKAIILESFLLRVMLFVVILRTPIASAVIETTVTGNEIQAGELLSSETGWGYYVT